MHGGEIAKSFDDLKKVKVASDGTMVGTEIFDSEGVPIPMVQEITIRISVSDPVPRAELVIYLPEVDMENISVEKVDTCSVPYYEIGSEGEAVGRAQVPRKKTDT